MDESTEPTFVVLGIHQGHERESRPFPHPAYGGEVRVRFFPHGRTQVARLAEDFVDEDLPLPPLPALPGLSLNIETVEALMRDDLMRRLAEL